VFFSLTNRDKEGGLLAARRFVELGFSIVATSGTADYLGANDVPVADVVAKVGEGSNTALDRIARGEIDLVVNTPHGLGSRADGAYIRTTANVHNVPCLTTMAAALAAAAGIADWAAHGLSVCSLQEYHEADQLQLPV
jgi:carbamoyl-phosphate synthase large subunit